MGIIVQGKDLWSALFTRTQCRVLALTFGYPDRSFYATEIVRLAGVGTGSTMRELSRLGKAGVLRMSRQGNQVHYQANPECPFFPELCAMVRKTFGALDLLRNCLAAEAGIELAFLFEDEKGSAALDSAPLNLLVVSAVLNRGQLEAKLVPVRAALGREIRLSLLRPERFKDLLYAKDQDLLGVLERRGPVLVGVLPA